MRYIYKHGNQYWYQRAVPVRLINVIGKKTLKISLKTNKISTALKRSKLQSLEHKKITAFAISSGFNSLPNGIFCSAFLTQLSSAL